MEGAKKERWEELCEQATKEQYTKKLMALVTEINVLLEAKRQRLAGIRPTEKQ